MFEKVSPLFQLMGKNIRLMGGPGAGQHTKMVRAAALSHPQCIEAIAVACVYGHH